jgi:hypothetical protein
MPKGKQTSLGLYVISKEAYEMWKASKRFTTSPMALKTSIVKDLAVLADRVNLDNRRHGRDESNLGSTTR